MSRQRVSKGQIIMKKEEKLPKVAAIMPVGFTDNDYVDVFKQVYSKYWDNIVKRYNEHEKLSKPGKGHPMAEPQKYLLNTSRKYLSEIRKKHSEGLVPTEEEVAELNIQIEKENRKKLRIIRVT